MKTFFSGVLTPLPRVCATDLILSYDHRLVCETFDALVHKNALLFFSIDRWLVPPKPKQPPASVYGKITALRPYQLTLPYMRNNYVYLIFLAVYVLVNALLFGTRIYQYRNSNIYTIFARACGKSNNIIIKRVCNSLRASYPMGTRIIL